MLDPSRPALIWSIWPYLSWLERLVFLGLCALAAYWLFLAATVARFQNPAGDLNSKPSARESLSRVRKRVTNLQQATVAAFYLFGFVLFVGFQFAYPVLGNTSTPGGLIVVKNFQIHFSFAANAFLILLLIQFIQWFVANRVSVVGPQSD
jgi:hypothetical protein